MKKYIFIALVAALLILTACQVKETTPTPTTTQPAETVSGDPAQEIDTSGLDELEQDIQQINQAL